MIISSTINALKTIVSKPAALIVVLISILFGQVLAQLSVIGWMPLSDFFTIWQNGTESPLIAILLGNPIEVLIILITTIISFTVSTMVLEFLARTIKEEKTKEALNDVVMGWKRSFGVAFTICISIGILITLLAFFVELGAVNELISLALVILLSIFTVFAFVKMIFVFPAMAEEKTAKLAIQKSWGFLKTYTAFGKVLLFLLLIGIIITLFDLGVLSIVTLLLQSGITDELLIDYAIPVIEDMFVTTFMGLAIASYFYKK